MALDPVKLKQPSLPLYQVLEEEFLAMGGEFKPAAEVEYRQLRKKAERAREIWRKAIARARATSHDEDDAACYQHERIFLAAQDDCLRVLFREFRRAGRSALCLSGGGIRSATFSLGAMSKLAEIGLLREFDYLSTVSGGGYAGGWLSALIHRLGMDRTMAALNPKRDDSEVAVLEPEAQPVRHLRDYSNFLHPDASLTSADTWTLASTVVRNIVLNWLILVPALLAILLVPRVLQLYAQGHPVTSWQGVAVLIGGAIGAALTVRYTVRHLPSSRRWVRKAANLGQISFLRRWLVPLLLGCIFTSLAWRWMAQPNSLGHWLTQPGSEWAWVLWGVALHLAGTVSGYWSLPLLAAAIPTGAGGGLLTFYALRMLATLDARIYTVAAVPVLLSIFGLLTMLFIGLATRYTTDEDREWWARAGAWSLIVTAAWTVVAAIALEGPPLLLHIPLWAKSGVTAAGGITGLITILLGRSAKTTAGRGPETPGGTKSAVYEWALKLAAPVFTVILLAAIALCGWAVITALPIREPGATLLTLCGAAALSLGAGALINVNKYTLHAMYRDRLIRAYLGASRNEAERQPDKFTGFDPADNLGMYEVRRRKLVHVVNIALNLVKGARLAWQQRKAESYTVSPWHMGSLRLGYRTTMASTDDSCEDAKRDENMSVGTAVAISGAAASPNMGYQSSSIITFLMTMFNARLGWWSGNPGEAGCRTWYKPGPANALKPLFAELFGLTNDAAQYVNLSDGGHFENLALYEMVLRRCRRIVVIDSGCDPQYRFEDLGNAVRKILIDFGIGIDFDDNFDFRPWKDQKASNTKCLHFALARIRYSNVDEGAPDGELLYIKPVLTGDESRDVLHYATVDERFPQQPTLTDQSYDETQFESYRRLGYHSIRSFAPQRLATLEDLFAAARNALPAARAAGAAAGAATT
ncbi:MAG TPA: patatin-like phospholipase family protein [Bryobacteraceae bacterium]|nr:patatin-like phospholipase family protein [Bryobacteraceae bacterium]